MPLTPTIASHTPFATLLICGFTMLFSLFCYRPNAFNIVNTGNKVKRKDRFCDDTRIFSAARSGAKSSPQSLINHFLMT
jgi:hypothetical protein